LQLNSLKALVFGPLLAKSEGRQALSLVSCDETQLREVGILTIVPVRRNGMLIAPSSAQGQASSLQILRCVIMSKQGLQGRLPKQMASNLPALM
jgi:hypothetical protein